MQKTNAIRIDHRRIHREAGQGMLEYILIVVFIAVAGIVVWRNFGEQVQGLIQGSSNAISEETDDILDEYQDDGR